MLVVRGGDGGLACAEFRHVRLDGERQHDQDRQCNCGKCERGNGKQAARTAGTIVPVSYTHLTLPTICSV